MIIVCFFPDGISAFTVYLFVFVELSIFAAQDVPQDPIAGAVPDSGCAAKDSGQASDSDVIMEIHQDSPKLAADKAGGSGEFPGVGWLCT